MSHFDSNNFSGKPLTSKPAIVRVVLDTPGAQITKVFQVTPVEFLAEELKLRHSKLSVSDTGRFTLHVHSNMWYEFDQMNVKP